MGRVRTSARRKREQTAHENKKEKPEVDSRLEQEAVDNRERTRGSMQTHLPDSIYASDEARQYVLDKAKEVQSGLDPEFPSFIKIMKKSHVTAGFRLSFPVPFCKEHLSEAGKVVILIDENGDVFNATYVGNGLGSGWKAFSTKHRLVDGDALVFQLVNSMALKVYVHRASDYSACNLGGSEQKKRKCKRMAKNNTESIQTPSPSQSNQVEDMKQDSNTKTSSLDIKSIIEIDGEDVMHNSLQGASTERGWGVQSTGHCIHCFQYKLGMKRKSAEAEAANKESQAVIEQNVKLRYFKACKVCMELDIAILLMPCKHLCLCKECEPKLHVCPICNTAKVTGVEVFLS